MIAVTVVVPVYNAQAWLPRFFTSLQRQSLGNFEVLLIDDASTDGSEQLMEKMAAADPRFRLIRQPQNEGCGVARNVGIREAAGETLCFADPDDLLPEHSLEVRYRAYKKHNAIVRACHDEIRDDGTVRTHETPPGKLPEIFSPATEAQRIGTNPFLCAHWTWLFPTKLLRRHSVFNGEGMRTAEDIVFLNRLFFHINRLVWIPDTVYFWMKHTESLSTTKYTAEHYDNYFQCCDIFYEEAEKHGQLSLADHFFNEYLMLYPSHMLSQVTAGKSDEEDVRHVIATILRIGERHRVLQRCLPALRNNLAQHVGLARLLHLSQHLELPPLANLILSQQMIIPLAQAGQFETIRSNGWSQEVSFDKWDRERGLLRARYLFCDTPQTELCMADSNPLTPAFTKNRSVFDGGTFRIFERILWLPIPATGTSRHVLIVAGRETGLNHTPEELKRAFAPRPLLDQSFPADIRALRTLARSNAMRTKFHNSWIFLDKDTEADDNAEHLYRWVLHNHPEINAWYVLNRDSHDWPRLEAEGFRLVPHGGMEHHALFLNSTKLISSQMDRYIFEPVEERYFSDFTWPEFICLPHGVTKDDVSDWFNSIPFDLFIAATRDEAASITADETAYVMTEKEVRLSGFPRYDKWLEPVQKENIVFVMPTWRSDLVGAWDGKGQRRNRNPEFASSNFVKMWKGLFDHPGLQALVKHYGYRVIYFAHPCFEDYLDDLPFPDFVEKRSKRHGSIISIMQKSKVLITDFSSVAYDMAYMRRPVIYYQYESKSQFVQSQKWTNGYIDYEKMGFGSVCRDEASLTLALEEVFRNDGVMTDHYARRVDATFAYNDANCCKRAYEFITETSNSTA